MSAAGSVKGVDGISGRIGTALPSAAAPLDAARLREDFPLLERTVNGHPLVYLDTAATSQKPRQVLDAVADYYELHNANVHRGVHTLGNEATAILEGGRERVARFIDAPADGVIFVRNTTEALNLVASSYARELLGPGDRVVLSDMEHHSNLVPWQMAAERAGFTLAFLSTGTDGVLRLDDAAELLSGPTKLVSLVHQSNVLGTINPIGEISALAHANGAVVCVDAAQSVPHMPVSVHDLGCDFLAFSGHKMCGPMGIGVLWGRSSLLERMPPFLGGGSMIHRVDLERSSWTAVPHKFEAGTPDVAGVAGLVAACDYLEGVGLARIHAHEATITRRVIETLDEIGGIDIYGSRNLAVHGGSVAFNLPGVHAHDVGTILDRCGVAVRAGHHCCQPLMRRLGVAATARASAYLYTTNEDIDALSEGLREVRRIFAA